MALRVRRRVGLERNEAGGGGTPNQGEEGKWYKGGEVSGQILGCGASESKGDFLLYMSLWDERM